MQITTNIQHYMKSLDTSREALGAAETSLIQDRVALDVRSRSVWLMEQEITDGATRYCPERIPSDQIRGSVKEIKAKIDALKKQMLRMQNEYYFYISPFNFRAGQTEEEVRTKYTEVRAQYQAASEEMNSLETLKEVRILAGLAYDSLFTSPTTSVELVISTSAQRLLFERKSFLWICSPVAHIAVL